VFKNWSIHIPDQCQHKFSGRGWQLELFLGRRGCVSTFHGLSFVFWFIIMNPSFVPHDNACKKLFTFSMVTCQESSAALHTLQLVFIDQLSRHPPGTQRHLRVSWMIPCADPMLMFSVVATVSTEICLFSLISASIWAVSVSLMAVHGWPERCSSMTDVLPSWNLSTHWYTFLSLIHLPPYYWIILLWISLGFAPSDHKNLITEGCSSVVQFSSGVAMILTLSFESCLSCCQNLPYRCLYML
jgi:hypothetical protein